MPGIEQPNVIDLVMHNADSNSVILVIVQTRRWDDSPIQLEQLRQKISTYASFALDGALQSAYPDASFSRIAIQLDCKGKPFPTMRDLLSQMQKDLRSYGITLDINSTS